MMFAKSNVIQRHIMGIDLGNSQINVALFEVWGQSIKLKGVGASVSSGLHKGKIVDISELKVAVNRAIQRATLSAGVQCSEIITNIPLGHVDFVTESAMVSSDSGHLTQNDFELAVQKCQQLMNQSGKTELMTFHQSAMVDGKHIFFDGVEGKHLELKMTSAFVDLNARASLLSMFEELKLDFQTFLPDPMVLGHLFFDQYRQDESLLFMDWGSQFVSVSSYKNEQLKYVHALAYSGQSISSDIEICLKTTAPEAERIKIIYGDASSYNVDVDDQIRIMTKMGVKMIKRRFLSQIIEARVEEILTLLQDRNESVFSQVDKVVILGQAARLSGLVGKLQSKLEKPVEFLDFNRFPAIQDAGSKGAYFLAMGLIEYAMDHDLIKEQAPESATFFSKVKEKVVALF